MSKATTTPTEETHLISALDNQDDVTTATRRQDGHRLKTIAMITFSLVLAVGAILKGIVFANKRSTPFSARLTAWYYHSFSSMDRFKVMAIIKARSPATSFEDPSSLQSMALEWMLTKDGYGPYLLRKGDVDSFMERFALVALYYVTGGPISWTFNGGSWLNPWQNHCYWRKDLSCDGFGFVDSLTLYDEGLIGTLPPEIGLLSLTRVLDLERNELSEKLPSEIGLMESLTKLNLADNSFTGSIPSVIGKLDLMEELQLNKNKFSGKIPPEIGQMTYLELLALDHNKLTGDLPTELGNLSKLTHLFLEHNFLEGTIAASQCKNPAAWFVVDCYAITCDCCVDTYDNRCSS